MFLDIFLSACHSQKELTSFPKTVNHNKSNENQQNRKLYGKLFLSSVPNQSANYKVWEKVFLSFMRHDFYQRTARSHGKFGEKVLTIWKKGDLS